MDQQCSSVATFVGHDYDKSLSRRSVDWRDSGIVIDEDHPFNSMEAICSFNSVTSINQTSSCPSEKIALDPDDDGDTILHLAVVGCSLEKVKDLLKICDLNAINNMMHTPLHVATMANRPEMVKALLVSGAKLNIQDRRGNTPLHKACQKGFKDIAIVMLDYLKDNQIVDGLTLKQHIEWTNFDGQTIIHLAALNDRRDIINILVDRYDANINCRDSRSGETIVHKAISKFNVDLVEFILSLNKHCNQADYYGRTPLDTIQVLKESRLDHSQFNTLIHISQLIINRIEVCIQNNGCCSNVDTGSRKSKTVQDSSDSSSSDYSDIDVDSYDE